MHARQTDITASKEPLIIPQASTASDGGKQDTRKGQPGSHADFPNGLKDVHEMAAAADALAGLIGEAATNQERKSKCPRVLADISHQPTQPLQLRDNRHLPLLWPSIEAWSQTRTKAGSLIRRCIAVWYSHAPQHRSTACRHAQCQGNNRLVVPGRQQCGKLACFVGNVHVPVCKPSSQAHQSPRTQDQALQPLHHAHVRSQASSASSRAFFPPSLELQGFFALDQAARKYRHSLVRNFHTRWTSRQEHPPRRSRLTRHQYFPGPSANVRWVRRRRDSQAGDSRHVGRFPD